MNTFRKGFSLAQVLFIFALIAVLSLLAIPPMAKAQPTSSDGLGMVTNLPPYINAATSSNVTSVVRLYNNSGLGLSWKYNASSGTANGILYMAPSVDGTNFSSTRWTLTGTPAATTDQCAVTNWSADQLRGYSAIGFFLMTNSSGTGAGIITNKGVMFRRPLN